MRAAKRAALSEYQQKGQIVVGEERWEFQAIPVSDDDWRTQHGDDFDMDKFECGVCHALLKNGICLTGCHLGPDGKRRFQQNMATFVRMAKEKLDGHD